MAEMQLVSSGTDWTFEPYGTQSAFYLIIAPSKYLIKLKISTQQKLPYLTLEYFS